MRGVAAAVLVEQNRAPRVGCGWASMGRDAGAVAGAGHRSTGREAPRGPRGDPNGLSRGRFRAPLRAVDAPRHDSGLVRTVVGLRGLASWRPCGVWTGVHRGHPRRAVHAPRRARRTRPAHQGWKDLLDLLELLGVLVGRRLDGGLGDRTPRDERLRTRESGALRRGEQPVVADPTEPLGQCCVARPEARLVAVQMA